MLDADKKKSQKLFTVAITESKELLKSILSAPRSDEDKIDEDKIKEMGKDLDKLLALYFSLAELLYQLNQDSEPNVEYFTRLRELQTGIVKLQEGLASLLLNTPVAQKLKESVTPEQEKKLNIFVENLKKANEIFKILDSTETINSLNEMIAELKPGQKEAPSFFELKKGISEKEKALKTQQCMYRIAALVSAVLVFAAPPLMLLTVLLCAQSENKDMKDNIKMCEKHLKILKTIDKDNIEESCNSIKTMVQDLSENFLGHTVGGIHRMSYLW